MSIWIATAAYILSLLVCIFAYAIEYLTQVIQVESFSQLLYTVQVSMGGAENTIFQILEGFFSSYALWILGLTAFYAWFVHQARQMKKGKNKENNRGAFKGGYFYNPSALNSTAVVGAVAAASIVAGQLYTGWNVLQIDEYLEEQKTVSTLYEDYYVNPRQTAIASPAKKKNLIHIYLESMESTYADESIGGGMESNLIPNLSALAKSQDAVDFSAPGSSQLNGSRVTNKTSWTIAGLVAQTSSTPITMGNSKYNREFGQETEFMPRITTLGQILESDGYHNVFMCGSQAEYGGRANYFRQHGNYEIFDVDTARDTGLIPEDYNEWWGFEDAKLFEFAKDKALSLASEGTPFNLTLLSADTHFKNGYLCPDCPDEYDEQYENVIACSDKRVYEFVQWLQQQDFYEDTVVVISGDHLSMDGLIPQLTGMDCTRRGLFMILNGPSYEGEDREFTTLDVFPTELEALGYQIDGHRLGLGTSLYSNVPTLCETMGFTELNRQIAYRSNYYDEQITAGDDTAEDSSGFWDSMFQEDEEDGQHQAHPAQQQ